MLCKLQSFNSEFSKIRVVFKYDRHMILGPRLNSFKNLNYMASIQTQMSETFHLAPNVTIPHTHFLLSKFMIPIIWLSGRKYVYS